MVLVMKRIFVFRTRTAAASFAAECDAHAAVPARGRVRGGRRIGRAQWDGKARAPRGWTGTHEVTPHPTGEEWGVFTDPSTEAHFSEHPNAVDWSLDWRVVEDD